ncbi:MAG: type II toxin-antitoxin system RelE/ParE family toxin [Desulfovibrio sp.]|jgi:putative addiction module killer protein|nr:type II toxin-antitoxin system RelE/ParE family toxin [Desulfovibrio sp.]MBQ2516569.1 type II toxin-antitoxin system RelE/ParE family toxin [Desulfovibrio sp.]
MKAVHYLTPDGRDPFQRWFDSLKDRRAKVMALRRIDRASQGNFGDHKPCRDGVSEMRLDVGPGYRIYYFLHGRELIVLLCGGEKHGQDEDVKTAVAFRRDYLNRLQ